MEITTKLANNYFDDELECLMSSEATSILGLLILITCTNKRFKECIMHIPMAMVCMYLIIRGRDVNALGRNL